MIVTTRITFLKSKLSILIKYLFNSILKIFREILYEKYSTPKKILIFRTGSIGDTICALPALSNIRDNFPESEFHILTNAGKGYASLVSIEKIIEKKFFQKILNYESISLKDLTKSLKKEKYDLVIQLPQYNASFYRLLRDMVYFSLIINIPAGFGWRIDGISIFRKSQQKHIKQINERDRLNNLLLENNLTVKRRDDFPFEITNVDTSMVNDILSSLEIDKNRIMIGIVVGAKRPQNRWPIEYFEEIVILLHNKYNVLFFGGPGDIELVEPLLKYNNTISFCGQLTPIQSGLLMQYCSVILSNDTGPMHLAYAFGTPVLALFSNRDFSNRWYPPQDGNNIVLRADNIPCSICFSEVCSNNICMKQISTDEVIDAIYKMLDSNKKIIN